MKKHSNHDLPKNVEAEGQLTVDVYRTLHGFCVETAVAGVHPDNLDIDVTSDHVTIRGSRKRETETDARNYYCRECFWGTFSRRIILPAEIDPCKTKAHLKNGILKIDTVLMPAHHTHAHDVEHKHISDVEP